MKTFFATFLAIIAAAAVIWTVKSIDDTSKARAQIEAIKSQTAQLERQAKDARDEREREYQESVAELNGEAKEQRSYNEKCRREWMGLSANCSEADCEQRLRDRMLADMEFMCKRWPWSCARGLAK